MRHPRPRCNVLVDSRLTARLAANGYVITACAETDRPLLRDCEARVGDCLFKIGWLCFGVVVLHDHLALLAVRRGRLDAVDLPELGLGLRGALLAFPAAHLDGVRLHVREGSSARSEREREHDR